MLKYLYILFICCALLQVSCGKKKQNPSATNANTQVSTDSLKIQNIRSLSELLSPDSRQLVSSWAPYQQLDQLIEKFYTYSAEEVLYSSSELATATKFAKDSISIDRLKEIDVTTRLNVLNNSALRLKDMASIPTISAAEINRETQQMLDAFGALNSKINNITGQIRLELEIQQIESQIKTKN